MVETTKEEFVPYPYKCNACDMNITWRLSKKDLDNGKVEKSPKNYGEKHSTIHPSLGCNGFAYPLFDKKKKEKVSENIEGDVEEKRKKLRWTLENLIKTTDTVRAIDVCRKRLINPFLYGSKPPVTTGILFHGKPDCGKTTVAMAILESSDIRKYYHVEYLEVDLSSYSHNEVIAAVTAAFNNARKNAIAAGKSAAIIFFDEIGGIINSGSSRVQGLLEDALKKNMDGSESIGKMLVILFGTCNDIYRMSDALKRRFSFRIAWRALQKEEKKLFLKTYLEAVLVDVHVDETCYCDDVYNLLERWGGSGFRELENQIDVWKGMYKKTVLEKTDLIEIIKDYNKVEEENEKNEELKELQELQEQQTEKKKHGRQPTNEDIPTFKAGNKSNAPQQQQQQHLDDDINNMHQTGRDLVLYYVGTSKKNPRTDLIGLTVEQIARKDPVYYAKSIRANELVQKALKGEEIVLTDNDFIKGTYIKTINKEVPITKKEEPKQSELDFNRPIPTKVERKIESKVEQKVKKEHVDLICSQCYHRHIIQIGTDEQYDDDVPLCCHDDLDNLSGCTAKMIIDRSVCSICKKPRDGDENIDDLGEGGFVHLKCILAKSEEEGSAEEYIANHTSEDQFAPTEIEKPKEEK